MLSKIFSLTVPSEIQVEPTKAGFKTVEVLQFTRNFRNLLGTYYQIPVQIY